MYVKKGDYKNIYSTKDLDRFVSAAVKAALGNDLDAASRDKYKKLLQLFGGYSAADIGSKKTAIDNACRLLQEIDALAKGGDIHEQTAQPVQPVLSDYLADYERSDEKSGTPVQLIPGVGPKLSEYLNKKGVRTVGDLFSYLPYRYEDRRKISVIADLKAGEAAVFTAKIIDFAIVHYHRRRIFEMVVADDTGSIGLKWFKFNSRFMSIFKRGDSLLITGQVKRYNYAREIHHPEIRTLHDPGAGAGSHDELSGIVPVYSETEGLKQRTIRKIIGKGLEHYLPFYFSPLDISISKKLGMIDLKDAVWNLHLPESSTDIDALNEFRTPCHKRVIFDEFFYLELALALKRRGRVIQHGLQFAHTRNCISELKKIIPFTLTAAQDRVLEEIAADMQSARPMHRLLQGDVGSGKTIVALFAIYIAARNDYQAAIMAPTEILAAQHYKTLAGYLDKLGVSSTLLTSGIRKKEREEILTRIKSGEIKVIIGTHAVIQKSVQMHRLGLAVIDEQHRFGVMQRTELTKKADRPIDVIIMTATPIPRTLAMTVYGDLDVSIIDEMPPGRSPVKTKVYYENQRAKVYDEIRREVQAGSQAYIVYPLVSE